MKRVGLVQALVAVAALAGCRAAVPTAGSFDDLRVGNIAEAGVVRSSADDLRPLQDLVNTSSGLQADVLGDVSWSLEGVTEDFSPLRGEHTVQAHTRDAPVSIGTVDALQTELASLPTSLTALIPGGVPAPTSIGDLDRLFKHVTLLTPAGSDFASLTWNDDPADVPRLVLASDLRLAAKRRSWLKLLVRSIDAGATYRQLIRPRVCGVPGTLECTQDGVTLFTGYRTVLTGSGQDAALPEQGLDFDVTLGSTTVHADVRTGLRCRFFIRPVLAVVLASGVFLRIAPPPFLGGLPSPPHLPGDSEALCELLDRFMTIGLMDQLRNQETTLMQVVALTVNPPRAQVTLRQAIQLAVASALPGVPSGRPSDATVAGILGGPFIGLPIQFSNRLAQASDRILVNAALDGTFVSSTGTSYTSVPISDAHGAFEDAAIQSLSAPAGSSVSLNSAAIDLTAFQHFCDAQASTLPACAACADGVAPAGYCAGGRYAAGQITLISAGTTGAATTIPSLPTLARILEGAPFIAQLLRDYFARPLPPGARYVGVAREAGDPRTAPIDLSYIMDPDKDGIDSSVDNCPLTFNDSQANADGDGLGDACDPCPGVDNPNRPGLGEAFANGDRDGDGIPNGCDCDIDGDRCINHGFNMANEACTPGIGEVFQGDSLAYTDSRVGADFDGDGIQDQCDADLDWDGVDNTFDNCPLGDGDAVFDPAVDKNPDQTDSGGPPQGDLCDPFCTSAGQPICDLPPGAYGPGAGAFPGGLPPARAALPYLPGIPNGSCIGFGCNVGGLMRCFGDEADRCLNFANDLSLSDGLGLRSVDLSTQSLGLDAAFGSFRVSSRDLDGDGLGEFVVSSPFASVSQGGTCPIGTDCVPFSLSEAGRVLVVGSASGQVLQEIDGEAAGEHLGAAFELSGDILAIGAPGANAGDGSLRLYELGVGGVRERQRLDGGVGAGLGAALAVYSESWPPTFVASSPGAGEWVAVDPLDGVRARSDRVNGNLTRVVVARDAQHVPFVVASDPGANNGAGALFFFDAAGRATGRVDGQPGDALGSSLVADAATLGAGRVGAGAPGRNADSGAVDIYDASGQVAQSLVYWGTRVGAVLAAPGDTNGDGQAELWVSMNVNGQAVTTRWNVAP